MKIAIYQQHPNHTEVFGSILQHLNAKEVDIYTVAYEQSYIPYFKHLRKEQYNTNDAFVLEMQARNAKTPVYDAIILITAHNVSQCMVNNLRRITKRIIAMHHIPSDTPHTDKRMCVSPLVPNAVYYFPVYQGHSPSLSPSAIPTYNLNEPLFVVIGNLTVRNVPDLARAVNSNKNSVFRLELYSSTRHSSRDKRVKAFHAAMTRQVIAAVKRAKFLLSVPMPDSYYYKNRLTGELPLAYSHCLPICLPRRLNEIYKLKGVVEYENSITEVFPRLISMSPEEHSTLVEAIQADRDRIIALNGELLRSLVH